MKTSSSKSPRQLRSEARIARERARKVREKAKEARDLGEDAMQLASRIIREDSDIAGHQQPTPKPTGSRRS